MAPTHASHVASRDGTILLTGATGYVGGRLLKVLEASGCRVRCLARNPEFLRGRVGPGTEVVRGDVSDAATLAEPMRGVAAAYYLVHSMASAKAFHEADARAARAFAEAARDAGVGRIVYLGGLGRGPGLSPHLASRQEVGRILRESGVSTVELRASIVIGSGSLSFELVRALVEKLPVMIAPRWIDVPAQPIAIEDLLEYLRAAATIPLSGSEVFEIGGSERVSYRGLMLEYARQRGLKRWIVSVPVLTPKLSSLWLGLVTPVYARVGRILVESLRNPTIVEYDRAARKFAVRPRGIAEAIERAIRNEDHEFAETRWSDALSVTSAPRRWGGVRLGHRIVDSRHIRLGSPPEDVFAAVERIGGENGWYFGDFLWRTRGFLDLLAGGAGMRRGRRDPRRLLPGDTVDFWRVESIERGRRLVLRAEMKLPGRAWLRFDVETAEGGGSVLHQTALFDPAGLTGLAYWYALYPVHLAVFRGMLRGIGRASASGG